MKTAIYIAHVFITRTPNFSQKFKEKILFSYKPHSTFYQWWKVARYD